MQDAALVLRDIHQPPAPPLWPLAPGWWLVFAAVVLAAGIWAWLAARRRKRRHLIAAVFDEALARAPTPAAEVAAMSELLRRAARRRDPAADTLDGEAWLRFLDDAPAANAARGSGDSLAPGSRSAPGGFSQGPGRLLLDGGYRREVDPTEVARLKPLARTRFLQWMAGR